MELSGVLEGPSPYPASCWRRDSGTRTLWRAEPGLLGAGDASRTGSRPSNGTPRTVLIAPTALLQPLAEFPHPLTLLSNAPVSRNEPLEALFVVRSLHPSLILSLFIVLPKDHSRLGVVMSNFRSLRVWVPGSAAMCGLGLSPAFPAFTHTDFHQPKESEYPLLRGMTTEMGTLLVA